MPNKNVNVKLTIAQTNSLLKYLNGMRSLSFKEQGQIKIALDKITRARDTAEERIERQTPNGNRS